MAILCLKCKLVNIKDLLWWKSLYG